MKKYLIAIIIILIFILIFLMFLSAMNFIMYLKISQIFQGAEEIVSSFSKTFGRLF